LETIEISKKAFLSIPIIGKQISVFSEKQLIQGNGYIKAANYSNFISFMCAEYERDRSGKAKIKRTFNVALPEEEEMKFYKVKKNKSDGEMLLLLGNKNKLPITILIK
jgi:hypothetical protein